MKTIDNPSTLAETADAAAVVLDEEFERLNPPLAADELARLEQSLLRDGCRDALVAWEGDNLLLDGHNRYRLCVKNGLPFRVATRAFPDRQAALAWIVEEQLARRNITVEAVSYLRGKRYLAEKQPHGGDRSKGARGQTELLRLAEELGRAFKVGASTIKRDAAFAAAVDKVAATCGEDAKRLLLSRDARVSRKDVLRLAQLGVKEQRQRWQEAQERGAGRLRLPSGRPAMLRLPTEPDALVRTLLQKLGAEGAEAVCHALQEALKAEAVAAAPE